MPLRQRTGSSHFQHSLLQSAFSSPFFLVYAKALDVAYTTLPSPSPSPASTSPHGGSVLQYIDHEALDYVSCIGLEDNEN
jgi:hypothetical protein